MGRGRAKRRHLRRRTPLRGDNYAYAFTPLQQRMTLGSTLEGHMDEVRLYDRAFSAVVAALE